MTAPPRNVAAAALESRRIAGSRIVPAPADAAAELGAKAARAVVTLKVCVGTSGSAQTVTVMRSSGSAAYDRAAIAEAKTWRFRPIEDSGRAIPVCTAMEVRASAR